MIPESRQRALSSLCLNGLYGCGFASCWAPKFSLHRELRQVATAAVTMHVADVQSRPDASRHEAQHASPPFNGHLHELENAATPERAPPRIPIEIILLWVKECCQRWVLSEPQLMGWHG